jgi:hypothetical protein
MTFRSIVFKNAIRNINYTTTRKNGSLTKKTNNKKTITKTKIITKKRKKNKIK